MKCKTIHKKLIFFVEGDLPEKEMQEVRFHLSGCSRCKAFAEEMKKTLNIVQLEKSAPVSPYFYTRLKARMEKQQEAVVGQESLSLWGRVLQPVMFSVLLMAGIYTGIKIGGQARAEKSLPLNTRTEVIPFLNEMQSEPLESFLME